MCYAPYRRSVYGPFVFGGATVNGKANPAILQNWLKLKGKRADFIFQQDGAPPHWSLIARQYLNATLHNRWIGSAGNDECVLLH